MPIVHFTDVHEGLRDHIHRWPYLHALHVLAANIFWVGFCAWFFQMHNHPHHSGLQEYNTSGPPLQSYLTHYWKPGKSTDEANNNFIDTAYFQTTTLLESRTTIENGTTGLRTWLASQVLAQYLISHPGKSHLILPDSIVVLKMEWSTECVEKKRVLELGSGTGFLGIIVASLQQLYHSQNEDNHGNGSLWLTDVNDEALIRCRDNAQLLCSKSRIIKFSLFSRLTYFCTQIARLHIPASTIVL